MPKECEEEPTDEPGKTMTFQIVDFYWQGSGRRQKRQKLELERKDGGQGDHRQKVNGKWCFLSALES